MPLDRDATLKQAEKLLRQGRLDGAIAEYLRLIEEQPRDWNAVNALGDLYVRAGDPARAVAQFTRIADFLFTEGFLPKAAALYKKALKVIPDDEHTLLRLSEVAAQQGLLADARAHLRQLGRQRRDRGDARGAAECLIRLARLDEADAEAKLAGARAAQALGDGALAASLFIESADALGEAQRPQEALEALAEAVALDDGNAELRRRLIHAAVAAGQIERVRALLTLESAGSDPGLLLALARVELAGGDEAAARTILTRLLSAAPGRAAALLDLADDTAQGGRPDAGFVCAEVVVDAALLAADWDGAVAALQRFLQHGPHLPALMKLVEVAVDADRGDVMRAAQAQLVDAYLEAGRAAEARVIAEDLVATDRDSPVHAQRLRRAFELLGLPAADADAVIHRYREPDALGEAIDLSLPAPDAGLHDADLHDADLHDAGLHDAGLHDAGQPDAGPAGAGADPDGTAEEAAAQAGVQAHLDDADPATDVIVLNAVEIDLSAVLADLSAAPPASVMPPAVSEDAPVDLEAVFAEIRTRAARQPDAHDAAERYARGLRHLEDGRPAAAVAELEAAARAPQLRFCAAERLGQLYIGQGDLAAGVEWLERAAEAAPPSPDDGRALLYDLAMALERMGEGARALAVLLELHADAPGYRDVPQRIAHLTRAQAGSHGP